LLPRLQSEYGYPLKGAQLMAEKLVACQPVIKGAFMKWWQAGEFTPLEVEGYTWNQLMEKHGMKPLAALVTLDWLLREPEKAKQSLRKGHDFIRTKKNG
jgi:hypothetical protein